jgi:hypothetical protein
MKKVLILCLIQCCVLFSFAQDVIRQQSCFDSLIFRQVDSIKQLMEKDGYHVLREASMAMESEYEMPVVIPLDEKVPYRFVFIGDYSSRLYEVRMYDWDEKEVAYQRKQWGDTEGNVIIFSYVPKFSEMHMLKPVQVNKKKKKGLCGYVMMFRRNPLVRKSAE